jgi:hypothetical protein
MRIPRSAVRAEDASELASEWSRDQVKKMVPEFTTGIHGNKMTSVAPRSWTARTEVPKDWAIIRPVRLYAEL